MMERSSTTAIWTKLHPDRLRFRPGVERIDDRTVVSRANTWWEAWRQYFF